MSRESKKIMADINITPFTDVVLVLLVIFMIVTPMIFENNVKINLPTTATKEVNDHPQKVIVQVTETGDYYVDNKRFSSTNEMDMNSLTSAIASRSYGETTMVIRGDRNCRYQLIVRLVDLAKSAKIKRVVLTTEARK